MSSIILLSNLAIHSYKPCDLLCAVSKRYYAAYPEDLPCKCIAGLHEKIITKLFIFPPAQIQVSPYSLRWNYFLSSKIFGMGLLQRWYVVALYSQTIRQMIVPRPPSQMFGVLVVCFISYEYVAREAKLPERLINVPLKVKNGQMVSSDWLHF